MNSPPFSVGYDASDANQLPDFATCLCASYHLIRCLTAGVGDVAGFKLQRDVFDAEFVVQFLVRSRQQRIAASRNGADEMGRQRGFGRTHSPDMQVVNFGHGGRVRDAA